MSRRVLLLALAGVVLLVAGGWITVTGGQEEPAPAASSTAPSSARSAPAAPTSQPDPEPETPATSTSDSRSESTTGTATPSSQGSSSTTAGEGDVEVPPAGQRTTMIKAARAFVTDLSATDRAPKQWWRQVEAHLTAQAATDMKGMDPSWMPAMQLTEGGWVVATDPEAGADSHAGELTSEVVVPTDRGKVSVTVRPDESGRRYLVMQYTLPEMQ